MYAKGHGFVELSRGRDLAADLHRAMPDIKATEETIRKSLVGSWRPEHSFAQVYAQALRLPRRPIQDATVRHCWRTDLRPILSSESSVFRWVGRGLSVGLGEGQSHAG
jgi:hypothetical protein